MRGFDIAMTLCVLSAFWNVATSIIIYRTLQKRQMPVSFLWLRVMAPVYAFRYRKATMTESGKTGPLFYHWIISINLALIFAVLAVIAAL